MPPPKKTTKPTTPAAKPTPAAPVAAPAQVAERSEIKGLGKTKAPAVTTPRQISSDDIARRAFEIYAGRGYAPGDQNADWLEAERQLKAGL